MNDSSIPSEREQRLNDILVEYLEAQRQGKAPARGELLARHAEFADDLAVFLDDQAALARIAPGIKPAAGASTINQATVGETPVPGGGAQAAATRLGNFGDYELIGEIARGGMGVVYRARQISLNRPVALKMILSGQLASAAEIERFRSEAEAAASLDHPHILPIYEVGEHEGHQYFSMKLVEGGSLAQVIADGRTPDAEFRTQMVRMLAQVARAVHYAHQRGILHRDLKPANILLAVASDQLPVARENHPVSISQTTDNRQLTTVPMVTDFGLAKRVEGDSKITHSGVVVGTPSYMAPEQAAGEKRLTTSADTYSLGAILYEMLTGRPPFKGDSVLETLQQVLYQEPQRPRSIDPTVDRDLETIALKCLEKEPGRRYESAAALADDLERWLDGVPIQARPATMAERLVKWAKRRPAIAGLTAAVIVVAAVGMSGIVWKWRHAVIAEKAARAAELTAIDAEHLARDAEQAALKAEHVARIAERAERDAKRDAIDKAEKERIARGKAEKAQQEEAVARKQEAEAKAAALKAQAEEAKARAAEEKARKQAEADRDAKMLALTRAEGLRLAAEADAARFKDPSLALLLAIEGAKRTPAHLTFTSLYGALNECREVRTLGDGGREERGWRIYQGDVQSARFMPDGKRVFTHAGGSWRIYEIATGKIEREWAGYNLPITGAVLNAEGTRAILLGHGYSMVRHGDGSMCHYTDRLAYVIDLTTGKETVRLRGAQYALCSAEFSPDGKHILTASWDSSARIHDAATGKLLRSFKKEIKSVFGDKALLSARWTPDGKHVLTVTSNIIRFSGGYEGWDKHKVIIDPAYDAEARPLGPTANSSGSMSISVDTAAVMAYLWDAETGKEITHYYKAPPSLLEFGHVWYPQTTDVAPDGETIAIAFDGGVATIYETVTGKHRHDLRGHEGNVTAVAFSPDGKRIATGGADRTVRIWDRETGVEKLRLRGHADTVTGLRFHEEGKLLVSWSADKTVRVWEVESGIEKASLRGHERALADADISPDGRTVVSAGDRTLRVWSLEPPKLPDIRLEGHKDKATALAYSPNGKLAVTVSPDQTARIWDTTTGKELRVLGEGRNMGAINMARFSPDGTQLVTAATNRAAHAGEKITTSAVVVWDVASGNQVRALSALDTGATAAVFSPDGNQILTVGDGYTRITSQTAPAKDAPKETPKETPKKDAPKKDEPAKPAPKKDEPAFKISFSVSSGTSADAGRIQLWDAVTGKLLMTVPGKKDTGQGMFRFGGDVYVPAFSPDGKRLMTYDENDSIPKLLDAVTGKVVTEIRGPQGWGKHQFLVTADNTRILMARGYSVFIHDAATGVRLAELRNFPREVQQMALSADGKRLVTAAGFYAHVWELESRKLLAVLKGHEAYLSAAAINADGTQVLTGASDKTAALWDVASGTMLALFRGHTDEVTQVAFRPDGKQAATVSKDGSARLWPTDLWPAVLARKTRELTPEERQRYGVPASDPKASKHYEDRIPEADPPPGGVGPAMFSLPKEPVDPVAEGKAAAELVPLRAQVEKAPADAEPLRQKLIELRRTYPATAAAVEAAGLLSRLPGPLAAIDPAKIPVAEKIAGQPKELVAVIGEHGRRHWARINHLKVSPAGRLVTSHGYDGTRLWDAETMTPRGQLQGEILGFAPGKDEPITADGNKLIFWDCTGAEPKQARTLELPGAEHINAVSPDGRFALGYADDWTNILIWKLTATPPSRHTLLKVPKQQGIDRLTFSAKGNWCALGPWNQTYLFDLSGDTPKQRPTLKLEKNSVHDMAFSPDEKLLAFAAGDEVRLHDLAAADTKLTASWKIAASWAGAIVFTPDGRSLAVAGHNIPVAVWDVSVSPPKEKTKLSASAERLAHAPDGKRLFGTHGCALRSWAVTEKGYMDRHTPRGHVEQVASLAFTADDRTLYSADGTVVRVWSLTTDGWSEKPRLASAADNIVLTPDGRTLIAGRYAFALWDLSGPEPRRRVQPMDQHHSTVAMSLSADGKLLARGSHEPLLTLTDIGGAEPKTRFVMKTSDKLGGTHSVSLSPDGRFLATAPRDHNGLDDDRLHMWRVTATGVEPLAFPWARTNRVAFGPDGKTLATAQDRDVLLWDLTPAIPTVRVRLAGAIPGSNWNYDFRFNDAGDRLITWVEKNLAVWDTASGKKLHGWDWPGHIGTVMPSHDGRHLAVGNPNGTIYILRLDGK